MLEALQKNEILDNELIINQSLNPNSFKFKESMNIIKKDPEIERQPNTKEGKKVFDYTDKKGGKWEIVIGKSGDNQYEIRVKKWQKIQKTGQWGWKTQKYETSVIAKDKKEFNKKLGGILDETIGSKNRVNLKKTGKKVFKDLNKISNTTQKTTHKVEQQPQNKQKQQDQQKGDIESNENKKMPEGLRLDHGVYIYRIQPGDIRSGLISKLSKYEPLSYLKEGYGWQGDGANSFNVGNYLPNSKFDKGVDLIVPNKEYIKDVNDFKKTQLTAIKNMKDNSKYGDKIKKLLQPKVKGGYGYSENDIANVMTAFARSESSRETWNNNIGECALFRYEPSQVFSYGYHHIALSLKNGEATKNLTGDKALNGLHFTVGETCDPIKSGMLFLAYCIEKCPNNYYNFFNIDQNVEWCCKMYNGSNWKNTNPNYDKKLKNNYKKIKELK